MNSSKATNQDFHVLRVLKMANGRQHISANHSPTEIVPRGPMRGGKRSHHTSSQVNITQNGSSKNIAWKRHSKNEEQNKAAVYNTEKTINNLALDAKLSETSATMKDLENLAIKERKHRRTQTQARNLSRHFKSWVFSPSGISREKLNIIKQLGKGKYGKVYLVEDKKTGFLMALKSIEKKLLIESKLLEQFIRQLKIQFYLSHPNIIKLYGFFDDPDNLYLLMELGCDGQLYDLVSNSRTLSEESTSYVTKSLLQVVKYMHVEKVLHRDLKPENIVLNLGTVKICDFGWAVHNNTEMRATFCGTPLYFSPELLEGSEYDEKVDLWAIGVLAFELLVGKSPFNLKQPKDLSRIITHGVEFPPGINISAQFKQFISKALQKNPNKRPSAIELLQTKFIKQYNQIETCEQLCIKKSQI